jgi:hypothetical protein
VGPSRTCSLAAPGSRPSVPPKRQRLAKLAAAGAVPAGPSPLPPVEDGDAVEVERCVNSFGLAYLGGYRLLAAEILAGRQVGIRIESTLLLFYDLNTRELLRTRDQLTHEQIKRLRGVRPAGPPPGLRPSRSGCSGEPPPPG